jgi:hypothetical protein
MPNPKVLSKLLNLSAESLYENIKTRIKDSEVRLSNNKFSYEGLRIYISGCEDWCQRELTETFDHIRGCKGHPTSFINLGKNSKDVNLIVC